MAGFWFPGQRGQRVWRGQLEITHDTVHRRLCDTLRCDKYTGSKYIRYIYMGDTPKGRNTRILHANCSLFLFRSILASQIPWEVVKHTLGPPIRTVWLIRIQ
jgi:hypothetical protein